MHSHKHTNTVSDNKASYPSTTQKYTTTSFKNLSKSRKVIWQRDICPSKLCYHQGLTTHFTQSNPQLSLNTKRRHNSSTLNLRVFKSNSIRHQPRRPVRVTTCWWLKRSARYSNITSVRKIKTNRGKFYWKSWLTQSSFIISIFS